MWKSENVDLTAGGKGAIIEPSVSLKIRSKANKLLGGRK
jgi:hypothetical protein